MVNCGSLLKLVLVAIFLVARSESGSAQGEKLASCCKTVTNKKINESITGYMVQKPHPPCVAAVILQTKSGLFCTQGSAPWVREKIIEFRQAKAQSTTASPTDVSLLSPASPTDVSLLSTASPTDVSLLSTASPTDVSLLSLIRSTASPPSSSTSQGDSE
uniref:Chemokine interleukin-8-like domain-containing protein n=1 Tax=Seriola dumerili TaxID=41447 RepID=A0A3B4TCE4_SERDU